MRGAEVMMTIFSRCLIGMLFSLTLAACGTTQTIQSRSMVQSVIESSPQETSMVSASDVRPSRYSAVFDTLQIPQVHVEAITPPSDEFLQHLRQALIKKIRSEHLFAHVVSKAAPRERGGVLTLNATILSWDEQPEGGILKIRLGIEDMGSSCEFTHATTTGTLKRTEARRTESLPYEIQPLLEGTAAFVTGFMRPTPHEM